MKKILAMVLSIGLVIPGLMTSLLAADTPPLPANDANFHLYKVNRDTKAVTTTPLITDEESRNLKPGDVRTYALGISNPATAANSVFMLNTKENWTITSNIEGTPSKYKDEFTVSRVFDTSIKDPFTGKTGMWVINLTVKKMGQVEASNVSINVSATYTEAGGRSHTWNHTARLTVGNLPMIDESDITNALGEGTTSAANTARASLEFSPGRYIITKEAFKAMTRPIVLRFEDANGRRYNISYGSVAESGQDIVNLEASMAVQQDLLKVEDQARINEQGIIWMSFYDRGETILNAKPEAVVNIPNHEAWADVLSAISNNDPNAASQVHVYTRSSGTSRWSELDPKRANVKIDPDRRNISFTPPVLQDFAVSPIAITGIAGTNLPLTTTAPADENVIVAPVVTPVEPVASPAPITPINEAAGNEGTGIGGAGTGARIPNTGLKDNIVMATVVASLTIISTGVSIYRRQKNKT